MVLRQEWWLWLIVVVLVANNLMRVVGGYHSSHTREQNGGKHMVYCVCRDGGIGGFHGQVGGEQYG